MAKGMSPGLGLNLNVTSRSTPPSSYASTTVLGTQVTALIATYQTIDTLNVNGASFADNAAFISAKAALKSELTAEIYALMALDQAQIAYQSSQGAYISSLQAQNRALLAETQGGGAAAAASAPTSASPPSSGVSGTACALLAGTSALIGGTLGFGVGRRTRRKR